MACGAWVAGEAYAVRRRDASAQDGASSAQDGASSAQDGASSARNCASSAQARRGPCALARRCAPSAWMVHAPCVRLRVPSSAGGREPTDAMRSLAFRRAAQRMWL